MPLKDALPLGVRQQLRRIMTPAWFGSLRRTSPLSRSWGFDRGTPVDRYYIEQFLEQHRSDIRGRVLEVKDNTYTTRFGAAVTRSDVLDIDPANPNATQIADLSAADNLPAGQFDCFILTQTLQMIFDTRGAIHHAHRLLRPGGVLLVTVPTTSRIMVPDFWRFTRSSCAKLFGDVFGPEHVTVSTRGNVLACIAFLEGMARQELKTRELEAHDEQFPLIVTVRAVKRPERAA